MSQFQGTSKVENMITNILDNGIIPSSRYVAMFGLPKTMQDNANQIPNLTIRCMSVTVPGRNISTAGYRIYGPARQMPYEILYGGEISLTYMLSRDMSERVIFEKWMSKVVSNENYKLGFYDDYIGSLEIYVLDRSDQYYYSATVEEIFPKTIGDLSMSNDRDNDYMTQEVTFGFRKYTSNYLLKQGPENNGGGILSGKNAAKNGGDGLGLAGIFGGIRKGAGDVVGGIGNVFSPKEPPQKQG